MPPSLKTKPKEEVNKKALVWIGSIIGVVVIAVAVLLIVGN
ncbi:hypothetical protein [Paenibacillus radicis (ex Gao et al. 2016)]|nr:hypothetical protein [Paenibacillus radicis (ex Gao et al. 2016)]